jgi:hypothetical protein
MEAKGGNDLDMLIREAVILTRWQARGTAGSVGASAWGACLARDWGVARLGSGEWEAASERARSKLGAQPPERPRGLEDEFVALLGMAGPAGEASGLRVLSASLDSSFERGAWLVSLDVACLPLLGQPRGCAGGPEALLAGIPSVVAQWSIANAALFGRGNLAALREELAARSQAANDRSALREWVPETEARDERGRL